MFKVCVQMTLKQLISHRQFSTPTVATQKLTLRMRLGKIREVFRSATIEEKEQFDQSILDYMSKVSTALQKPILLSSISDINQTDSNEIDPQWTSHPLVDAVSTLNAVISRTPVAQV
jgi:hypothetical protein